MSSDVPSPCISICQIDPVSGTCRGCYRNRKEIGRWQAMSGPEQTALLEDLKKRRAEATGVPRRPARRRSPAS